jgi:excisionase family DNA binding protein
MAPALQIGHGSIEPQVGRSVSLEQAAALLGVSRRTIYNRIREGRLATIRTLGGSQRVLSESVAILLDRAARPRMVGAPGPVLTAGSPERHP